MISIHFNLILTVTMRRILSQFYLHGDSMRQDDDLKMAGEKKKKMAGETWV